MVSSCTAVEFRDTGYCLRHRDMKEEVQISENERPPEPIVISHGVENSGSEFPLVFSAITGVAATLLFLMGILNGDEELCCCGILISIPAEFLVLAHILSPKKPKLEFQRSS
ncbi:MAG: hypothetical protein CMB42_02255 [Euryarchaeota archaeon]|nr:hypothetical protein [Euryarchaeota archaeon]